MASSSEESSDTDDFGLFDFVESMRGAILQLVEDSSTDSDTSSSSGSSDDLIGQLMQEVAARMSENWIETMETEEEISSSMDLILKSISKLQVDCREKMATASSSEQSDDLQSSIDETLELVRNADQKIKGRLEGNKVKATTKLQRAWQMFFRSIQHVFNILNENAAPSILEFQQNVVQSLRQDGNKISADDFCNWIEVIVLKLKIMYSLIYCIPVSRQFFLETIHGHGFKRIRLFSTRYWS